MSFESTARNLPQFSLGTLMLAMTGICCVFGIVAFPPLLALLVAIYAALASGVLLSLIWKGKGWAQAFAIGAILPHALGIIGMFGSPSPMAAVFAFLGVELLACCVGVGTAAGHGWLTRRGGMAPIPNLPFLRDWFVNER